MREGYVEIPHGSEMQAQVVNNVQKSRNGEEAVGVSHALEILDYCCK